MLYFYATTILKLSVLQRRIVLWNGALFFDCNGAVGTDVLTALFFGGTYGRFDFEFASN